MSWRTTAYRAVRPLLFLADPEFVHHLTLRMLGSAPGRALAPLASGAPTGDTEPIDLMGLRFRNRVGLGAGFDKDGAAIRGWAALGLGFVELGTVTPRPQPGTQRPRLFRLPADEALINRMGFNNDGSDALARRIADARPHLPPGFVVGVNIGRSRDGDADDYPAAARAVAEVADYLAINVSSPNTPGLRGLQEPELLRRIVESVADAAPGRPLLVKVSPDLSDDERSALLDGLAGAPMAGLIVANTTVTRPGLRSRRLAQEAGGLSGRPLLPRTTAAVKQLDGTGLVLVGSGGIASAADVEQVRGAGADLVQLWTGMIYRGPGLIGEAVGAAHAEVDHLDGDQGHRAPSRGLLGCTGLAKVRGQDAPLRVRSAVRHDHHRSQALDSGCLRGSGASPGHRAARSEGAGDHRARRRRRQPVAHTGLPARGRVRVGRHRHRRRREPLPRLRGRHRRLLDRPQPSPGRGRNQGAGRAADPHRRDRLLRAAVRGAHGAPGGHRAVRARRRASS